MARRRHSDAGSRVFPSGVAPGANRRAPRRGSGQAFGCVRCSAAACTACGRTAARWPTLASAAAAATAVCGLGVGLRCARARRSVVPVAARAASILVVALLVHGNSLLVAVVVRGSMGQTPGSRAHYGKWSHPRAGPARRPCRARNSLDARRLLEKSRLPVVSSTRSNKHFFQQIEGPSDKQRC